MVSASTTKPYMWTQVQNMSEEFLPCLSGHSVIYSETPVKRAYLFGGYDGAKAHNDLWMWKVEEQAWERIRKPEEFDENEEESKRPVF